MRWSFPVSVDQDTSGLGGIAMTITGSCLCGGVKNRLEGDMQLVNHCHCANCRKASFCMPLPASPVNSATSRAPQTFRDVGREAIGLDYRDGEQTA